MDKKKKKTILILAIIFLFVVAFLITGGFFLKKKLDSKKDKQVENKVTITFDLGGGTGTFDPLKINKGETISKPSSVPEKPGFTFKHWSQEADGEEFDFSKPIKSDTKLFAVWEPVPIEKVKVTFDLQGGSGTFDPITINKGETITEPSTNPTKLGHNFKHWSTEVNGPEFDFTNPINDNLILYAVWEAIPKVTVTFDLQGGSGTFDPITINKGETITKPSTNPVKDNHTFKHWSTEVNGTEFNFSLPISDNLTLYAVYEAIPKVTVTFDLQGGTGNFDPITINKGVQLAKPSTDPVKSGFVFKHWSTEINGSEFDFSTSINDSLTLYAVYETIPKVTVTFDLQGGSGTFDPITINKGEIITKPSTNPTKPGFTFKHWSTEIDGSEFDFTNPINESLTLYTVYEVIPKVTVTFDLQGGVGAFDPVTVNKGETIIKPSVNPTKPDHIFKYWSNEIGGSEFSFTNPINESLTLYAVWEAIPKVTVTFDLQGGVGTFDPVTVNKGETISKPTTEPHKVDHTFKHWSTEINGSEFDFANPINDNLILYAVWEAIPKVTVTFNLQGGVGTFDPITINKGETITKPSTNPSKSDFTFKHWSTEVNGTEFDFTNPINESLTLYAVWEAIPKVTVTFDLQGGNGTFNPITVNKGETITKPSANPTKLGHNFKHWSTEIGGSEFDFTTPINESLTLYAVWEIQTKTVTFITYEGEEVDETTLTGAPVTFASQTVNYGTLLDNTGEMLFLTAVSHTFKYWSKTKNGPEFNVRTETITEDLTLHAVWEAKKYTVTFNTQYDAITIPSQTVKHGKEATDPRTTGTVMYRPGYAFKFFSLSSDGLNGEYNFTNKVTEDITIYAVWEKEAVKQMALGYKHTLLLTNTNKLYASGNNQYGQLGLGNKNNQKALLEINSDNYNNKTIAKIYAGGSHSFILTEDGEVYAFGNNKNGQLGLDDNLERLIPTKIDSTHYGNKKIIEISAGSLHSLILTEDGEVYAFGNNKKGQLGLNDTDERLVPTKIDSNYYGNKKITQISTGDSHSLILTEDGEVYAFGYNGKGQLGLNNKTDRLVPTKIDSTHYGNKKIAQIFAGSLHSFVLTEDGEIYAFGLNGNGQLGLNDKTDRLVPTKIDSTHYGNKKITQISLGGLHSLILTEDGEAYAFGYNKKGQLGLGYVEEYLIPTKINSTEKIIQIAAGGSHSAFSVIDGKTYTFGQNDSGQLGLNDNVEYHSPTEINI